MEEGFGLRMYGGGVRVMHVFVSGSKWMGYGGGWMKNGVEERGGVEKGVGVRMR